MRTAPAFTTFAAVILLTGCATTNVVLSSKEARISGAIDKPDGAGPFPAVVLMHGCGGVQPGNTIWAHDLHDWGYVTIQVDSFSYRGVRDICSNTRKVPVSERTADAYTALQHLRSLPYVAKDRVAIMGWSHGGMVVLSALYERNRPAGGGFKTGVAMYPWCDYRPFYAPLLIVIGSADDWTPAERCETFRGVEGVELQVYEGAYHSFDNPGPARTYLGHTVGYDNTATVKAKKRVREFLGKNL